MENILRLAAALLLYCLFTQTIFAHDIHYRGPNPDLRCWKIDIYASASPIDEAWFFCLETDQTSTDPNRPPIVLGGSGPWTVTEVSTDPNGNPMPFIGLKFTLDPEGVPATSGALFTHPTTLMPDGTVFTIIEFWHEIGGGYISSSGSPVGVFVTIPSEMTNPYEIAQHIWDNRDNVIPTLSEWGVIILILLLLAVGMVFIYKRQTALALAGSVEDAGSKRLLLFNKQLYAKVFGFTLIAGFAFLGLTYLVVGEITSADPLGTFVSTAIIAYMIHFMILRRSH